MIFADVVTVMHRNGSWYFAKRHTVAQKANKLFEMIYIK